MIERSDPSTMNLCPFCLDLEKQDPARLLLLTVHSAVLADRYPVAPGHALVVPRRHAARVSDLLEGEWLDLSSTAHTWISQTASQGFTLGVNDGEVAGQTVPHVHLHVIPRSHGDVPDPRGGVRMLFPNGRYWN